MADLATLRSLRERVIAATGADREIDAVVWFALTPGATRQKTHVPHWKQPYDIDETRDETSTLIIVPSYTSSLDAAVALVERCLPGWEWNVALYCGCFGQACLREPEHDEPQKLHIEQTVPLALLAALLSALIAQAEQENADA